MKSNSSKAMPKEVLALAASALDPKGPLSKNGGDSFENTERPNFE